ncbi:type II secretion system protein N [Thalassotalea castellviae]|uniref:Type II secretion system protein N n=1 Tax=Thalassotalea castellviae TaxID=3075612 RepID=A0ABU3A1C4_9GAMM|nr:type II secretion system protein N [Thalassotalea sp. W431]MDT0603969.1 type II secretion system protein N [Thalassotalea sp. W431]
MAKWFKISVGVIGAYVIFLLALMPASFVLQWVTLPSQLQLSTVNGTIWQSKIKTANYNGFIVNDIKIDVSPLSLLTLDPNIDLTFGGALVSGPEGVANIHGLFSALRITDAKITLSADNISSHLKLPLPVKAHDFVDINVSEFVAGNAICQSLTGDIAWNKAAVTVLDQKVALGKLSTSLSCEQGDVVLTLDEQNELGLSFTASVSQGFAVSGNGFLTPNNTMPKALEQVLPFLGKPDRQGRYLLRF